MPLPPEVIQQIMQAAKQAQAPTQPTPTGSMPGMPMMPPQYSPLAGGAGAGGDPMTNWIGIQGIIKRLYPSASDEEIRRMLTESQRGAGQPGY